MRSIGRDPTRVHFLIVLVFGWLLVGSGAVGCGDSFIASNTTAGDDQEKPDDGPSDFEVDYLLVPSGPKDLDVSVHKTVPLEVLLLDKKTGEPATDKTINFELTSGESKGSLSTRNVVTDESGVAGAMFRAEAKTGDVEVQVDHPKARAVEFTISVNSVPTGGLRVDPVNTGASVISLNTIGIRIYDASDFACAEFRPLASDQPEHMKATSTERPGEPVEFGNLSTEDEYTITGVARGGRGQIAAGGCKEDVRVPDEMIAEEELLLHLVPINPSGRYHAETYYDFSNALKDSGVVGKNIIRILDIFKNPGDAIYREIINLVENLVGDLAGKGINWVLDKTGLDDKFKNMINNAVQNNDTLCRVREAGRDLRDVLTHLNIESELTIGKLRSDYEFQGRSNWLGITVYWRAQCEGAIDDVCSKEMDPGMGNPGDRQKPCAAIRLAPEGDNELQDIGLWASEWKGRVTSYNQLQVGKHPIPLNYGQLIKYLLDEKILPELTDGNAHSLAEAFGYWLGCDDLGKSITGSDGEVCTPDPIKKCITDQDISGFCNSAVGTIFGAADLVLGELKFDTGIFVSGDATLVETTSDGRIDYIEDGAYEGYIEVEAEGLAKGRSPISGEWTAERISSRNVTDQ